MKWNGKQETEKMPNIYTHVYFVTEHKMLNNTDAVCAAYINNYMMILQFPLTHKTIYSINSILTSSLYAKLMQI